MKIPKLEKKRNVTNLHGYEIIDDYSWVHQKDILEVLTDKKKLLPEVRAVSYTHLTLPTTPYV